MTESTAIVLFTDLVGSTELRSRLGEDAAEALRHQHDALVTGAIEACRGTVVKNLGDGIMATFADWDSRRSSGTPAGSSAELDASKGRPEMA